MEIQLVLEQIQKNSSECITNRKPLQLHKKKAVSIDTFLPKFIQEFNYFNYSRYSVDRKYDSNKSRLETQKLSRQYKKEFKGAARELKKDAHFISRHKLSSVKEKDLEYKKKMDVIMGQLANQEGAMRGYEREKKRKRK